MERRKKSFGGIKMKTFTNKKGNCYLLLDVPDDYQTGKCYGNQFNYWTEKHPYNDCYPTLVLLPKGNYELIGLAKDVSESQAKDIIDSVNDEGLTKYFNYLKGYYYHSLFSSTESLSSLVQSLGLNNPIILKLIK